MKAALAVASLITVIAPAAHAAYDRYGNYYEAPSSVITFSDRVDNREPLYVAESREECWNTRNGRFESRPESRSGVGAGAAVGAVAGGVIGHQVGSGRGNDAATIGGALLGGLIGHQVQKDRRNDHPDFDLNRCRTVAATDYSNSYSYNNERYIDRSNDRYYDRSNDRYYDRNRDWR